MKLFTGTSHFSITRHKKKKKVDVFQRENYRIIFKQINIVIHWSQDFKQMPQTYAPKNFRVTELKINVKGQIISWAFDWLQQICTLQ